MRARCQVLVLAMTAFCVSVYLRAPSREQHPAAASLPSRPCPRLSEAFTDGHWLFANASADLRGICQSKGYGDRVDCDRDKVRWVPRSHAGTCGRRLEYRWFDRAMLRKCLATTHLVFAGDSVMRGIFAEVKILLDHCADKQKDACASFVDMSRQQQKKFCHKLGNCEGRSLTYLSNIDSKHVWDMSAPWSHKLARPRSGVVPQEDTDTVVLMNTGIHRLLPAKGPPMNTSQWNQTIPHIRDAILKDPVFAPRIASNRMRAYWMTNTLVFPREKFGLAPNDVLAKFNDISKAALATSGMEIIDLWKVTYRSCAVGKRDELFPSPQGALKMLPPGKLREYCALYQDHVHHGGTLAKSLANIFLNVACPL